jgi:hypothetical protein
MDYGQKVKSPQYSCSGTDFATIELPIGLRFLSIRGDAMPIIVKIIDGDGTPRKPRPDAMGEGESAAGAKPMGLMLFNDSMLVASLNDRDLVASIEKIDIAELEKDIQEGPKNAQVKKAKKEVLKGRDILAEERRGVKSKSSIGDCADARSTRNRISRLLSQSM